MNSGSCSQISSSCNCPIVIYKQNELNSGNVTPLCTHERVSVACRIGNPGRFCLCHPESWVVDSGIELKESEIPLTTGVQNPSSTDKYWNSVPGIRNPQCVESRIQECPWFAYMGWYVTLRSSFTFTIRNTHDCSKLFVPTKCTSVRTWKLPDGGKWSNKLSKHTCHFLTISSIWKKECKKLQIGN